MNVLLRRALSIFIAIHGCRAASKAGMAWPNGPYVNISQFTASGGVSWYYTWSPDSGNIDSDLEFVPMLWGYDQVADFSANINQTIANNHVSHILAMNEPEQPTQSNMTPAQGAQMWQTYLEPLRAQGVMLGSPAPSSAPAGLTWIQDFLAACNGGCTVDFIALHWYDVNATAFQEYLETFYSTFQLPLWVTEWACQNYNDVNAQCSQQDILSFMNQTQGFMDASSFVERYSWFGAMENLQGVNPDDALMDTSGKINALGEQYIAAEATSNNTSSPGVTVSSACKTPPSWVVAFAVAAVSGFSIL